MTTKPARLSAGGDNCSRNKSGQVSRSLPCMDLQLTGDPQADRILSDHPLALVIGMLLDQQVPLEWAFSSPTAACRSG